MSTTKLSVPKPGAVYETSRFVRRNRCVASSFRMGGTHGCTIEGFPDAAAEYSRAVRFLQDGDAAFHHPGQCSCFIAIAGGKDNGNTRLHCLDGFISFRATPAGHDDIQQDESDRIAVSGKNSHSLFAVLSDQNLITQRFQRGARHFADAFMIFGNQDGLLAATDRQILDGGRPVFKRRDIFTYREKDVKRASPSWFAFHLNEPSVLFHNAIDCGQSQPRALPGSLRREEGLKDPFANSRVC